MALTFKHLMHRLVVNLTAGDGMTDTDLSSALINSVAKNNAPTMLAQRGGEPADRRSELWQRNGQCNPLQRRWCQCRLDSSPQDLTAGAEWLKITVDGMCGTIMYLPT